MGGDPINGIDPLGLFDVSDAVVGFGDSFLIPKLVKSALDIGTTDHCSPSYQTGNLVGVLYGLGVPLGRVAYIGAVSRIPKVAASAEEAVALRNAAKAYFRGRPLSSIINDYKSVEGLMELGKTAEEIVAGAGRANAGWSAGIIGTGLPKSAPDYSEGMTVDAAINFPHKILVKLYPEGSRQDKYHYEYDIDRDRLSPIKNTITESSGWIFGMEWTLQGRRNDGLVLFRFRQRLYLAANGRAFELGESRIELDHARSLFWCEVQLRQAGTVLLKYRYLAPWWRAFTDDGMFPEDRDPMKLLVSISRDQSRQHRILEHLQEPKI